jgi:hypothetical protein
MLRNPQETVKWQRGHEWEATALATKALPKIDII